MLRIPEKLLPYVDFDEGKVVAVNLPPDLESEFADFEKMYEEAKNDSLTDY